MNDGNGNYKIIFISNKAKSWGYGFE